MTSTPFPANSGLKAILDAAGTMIIATDREGKVRFFNPAAERLLGWSAAEVVGRHTPVLWHDREELTARAAELSHELGRTMLPGFEVFVAKARDQLNEERQWTFIRKDGNRFPVSLIVSAIRDESGGISGYVGTAKDLTIRVKAEQERDRYFNFSLDLLGIASTDGYFKRINPTFNRVLGWTDEEFLSRPFLDLVHPADQAATTLELKKLAAGEPTLHFENRYRCKDGSWRWIAWTCATQPDSSLYASGRDVTELKQAEERLRQTQRDLETTLNSIGDAVLATDAARRITRMNPVAEQLTGWTQSEAMGRPIDEVFHIINEETRLPAVIPVDDVLATGTVQGLANHTLLISRNGTECPIADCAAPIIDDAGQIAGVVLVFRDASKERTFERELQESNALLEEQVALRTDELQKEQRRLRYGNLVLESIASEAPIHETIQLITKFVTDEGMAAGYGILLLDEKHEWLEPILNRNLPESLAEAFIRPRVDEPTNWLWQSILAGRREAVEDLAKVGFVGSDQWRSSWVDPILSGDGKVLGGFVAFYQQVGPPSAEELAMVECACRLARFAIQHLQHRASLEASEQRHRALLEHFPAPVFVYDRETLRYLAVSDRAVDEYGYSREEFMQMTVADIRPDEDLPAFLKMIRESGTTFELRGLWRHRRKNGTLIDVEITTHGFELTGRPACIVLAQDVTEKLRAENSLRRSEALNLAILQSSLDCIVTMNATGEIVEFNRAAEQTFGYTRAQALGRLVRDLMIPAEHRQRHDEGIARYLKTGEQRIICRRIQTTALRSNGQTFPVELTVVPVNVEGELLFTAFLRDQTAALRSEQELRRTTELLQAIADGTTDAIFIKDKQGRYLLFNRAAAKLTGRPVEEVLGKDDYFLFGEEYGRIVTANDRQVMWSNQPLIVEEELAASGVLRNYQAMKAPWRDPEGKVLGIIGISRDVTERKQMESALRASEVRYRSIVERSPDVIFVNRNDCITFINQAGVELLGATSAKQIIGHSPLKYFHPDDHWLIQQRIAKLRRGPGTVPLTEERMIALDGRVVDVEVQASSYFSDGSLEIQVVCRDITARKNAEQKLRRYVGYAEFNAALGLGLSQMPTLPQMLQSCVDAMVTHLNVDFARVWLVNEQTHRLELQAGAGVCPKLDTLLAQVEIGHQTIGRIAADKSPYTTESILEGLDVGDVDWARSNKLVSFAGFPLLVDGRCLGVVAVFSREPLDRKLPDHLAMAANGMAQNIERKNATTLLTELNATLEQRIIQRTLELESSEQFNRATLDALSAHVAVVDQSGNVVATNAAWRKFAEKNGADIQCVSEGANYLLVCDAAANRGDPDAAIIASALREVLSGGSSSWSHEYACHSPTEQRWFTCRVTLTYIDQQPHAVVAHENITSIKLAQEELRAATEKAVLASQYKSDFLATMSHELRTPLNGILGMNQLLLTTELSDRQRECVMACSASGQLLLQLINDILDISRIEAGKLELDPRECDLEAFIYDVVDMMAPAAQANQLTLNCQISHGACVVGVFDDARLRQVLVNLISNAIKFTSSGSITVAVNDVATAERTARLRFTVNDTGIGIPKDRLDRLFKSFSQVDSSTTRQFGGTGLGLSICKQLVELMGGEIGVESQVGVGTTFWFEIEVLTSPVESIAAQAKLLLAETSIIVIDDLNRERIQVAECLRSWGCPFQQVTTSHDASTTVRNAAMAGRPYRIILADCRLVASDEFVQLRELAAEYNLHIIGLGYLSSDVSRDYLDSLGIQYVLDDPIRPSSLFDALAEVLSVRKEAVPIQPPLSPGRLRQARQSVMLLAR